MMNIKSPGVTHSVPQEELSSPHAIPLRPFSVAYPSCHTTPSRPCCCRIFTVIIKFTSNKAATNYPQRLNFYTAKINKFFYGVAFGGFFLRELIALFNFE